MLKFGVEVILYYPDRIVFQNIENYQRNFEYILLYDNTPKEDIRYEIFCDKKTTYLSNGINDGLSIAIAEGIKWANKIGVDYILTMDQDSEFDGENIKKMIRAIQNDAERKISIYAANYRKIQYKGDKVLYTKPHYDNRRDRYINFSMTSGSFMKTKDILNLLPLKDLFIGFVDNDICYSLRTNGYKIKLISDAVLSQRVGTGIKGTFFNRIFHKVILSPARYYFMGRNSKYLLNKYKGNNIAKEIRVIRLRIVFNLLACEEHKINKIKEWIRGSKEWKTL